MKIVDVFLNSGIKIPGVTIVTDRIFKTVCNTCQESQILSKCSVLVNGDITYYKCKNGCDKELVVIYKFGSKTNSDGHTYRLKDYVVKSYSDLFIIMANGTAIQLPK